MSRTRLAAALALLVGLAATAAVAERRIEIYRPQTRTVDRAAALAARLLAEQPDGFTVADFRDAAGITRKHALPLLAELDARAVTRRRDDLRVAGPRVPEP